MVPALHLEFKLVTLSSAHAHAAGIKKMNAKPTRFMDDLKERLNNLELEQRRQNTALTQLGDLEEEVMRLEARLKHIDGDLGVKQTTKTNFNKMRDLDETVRLERELKEMDDTELKDFNEKRYFEEINQLRSELGTVQQDLKTASSKASAAKSTSSPTPEAKSIAPVQPARPARADDIAEVNIPAVNIAPEPKDISVSKMTKTVLQQGYVVCLMFNPRSPTEWSEESGGGWRERGQGQCYPTVEYARAALAKLKQQWPRHPLKIIKR